MDEKMYVIFKIQFDFAFRSVVQYIINQIKRIDKGKRKNTRGVELTTFWL